MYPIYAKCVELGVPIFSCAGVPGPRLPMWPQKVELIDQVMYDFPELVFVTRHGCEPWEDLAMKLMLKWPNLYYSTSAFAPKHYPKAIVDYANTRGADKIIYAGYFPMGLSLERIMADMPKVPFKDEVWPKFLREQRTQGPEARVAAPPAGLSGGHPPRQRLRSRTELPGQITTRFHRPRRRTRTLRGNDISGETRCSALYRLFFVQSERANSCRYACGDHCRRRSRRLRWAPVSLTRRCPSASSSVNARRRHCAYSRPTLCSRGP